MPSRRPAHLRGPWVCRCGERDRRQFYANSPWSCKRCHRRRIHDAQVERRQHLKQRRQELLTKLTEHRCDCATCRVHRQWLREVRVALLRMDGARGPDWKRRTRGKAA